jgi:hypothetical protein
MEIRDRKPSRSAMIQRETGIQNEIFVDTAIRHGAISLTQLSRSDRSQMFCERSGLSVTAQSYGREARRRASGLRRVQRQIQRCAPMSHLSPIAYFFPPQMRFDLKTNLLLQQV